MDLASLVSLLLSLTAEIFGAAWILSCTDNLNGFLEHPTECLLETVFRRANSDNRSEAI